MASTSDATPSDRRYTAEHEWIKADEAEAGVYIVGITSFAQDQLGDIVYVELPKVGELVEAGGTFGVIESVKTASDLYAPVSGQVIAVNEGLQQEPQAINDDPYASGWMIKLRPDDSAGVDALMDAAQYDDQIGS